jgi:putative transposase
MGDTYMQIYVQTVFAVKNRKVLIDLTWGENLYKYITGIVQNKGQKMLAINGMPNHIHFLIGMKPFCCFSDLVREIKKSSNSFVKENKFTTHPFNWQEGFGAFSHSQSQSDSVIGYIRNQKIHHQQKTFKKEYIELPDKFKVEYKNEYLFDWFEIKTDILINRCQHSIFFVQTNLKWKK